MERRIKLFMFIVLVFNSILWLNNISFYPSLCFPRFNPSTSSTNATISFTNFHFENKKKEVLTKEAVLLNFKPYDKRFYLFSLKRMQNKEVTYEEIKEMPSFVEQYKDTVEF